MTGCACPIGRREDVSEIDAALRAGESINAIHRRLGIAKSTLSRHREHLDLGAGEDVERSTEQGAEDVEPLGTVGGTVVPAADARASSLSTDPVLDASPGSALATPRQLADLVALVARLPLRQQDRFLVALPLAKLRLAAVERGLAEHREAAAAVARELRGVDL
jgi:hypothetical protein